MGKKDVKTSLAEKEALLEQVFSRSDITKFSTGATRSPLGNKPEYAGYLSPAVIKRFGEYMLKNQIQDDGSRRDSRNWQKGIPLESYMQSMFRHFMVVWCNYESGKLSDCEEDLMALMFNVMGMSHEVLKGGDASDKHLEMEL